MIYCIGAATYSYACVHFQAECNSHQIATWIQLTTRSLVYKYASLEYWLPLWCNCGRFARPQAAGLMFGIVFLGHGQGQPVLLVTNYTLLPALPEGSRNTLMSNYFYQHFTLQCHLKTTLHCLAWSTRMCFKCLHAMSNLCMITVYSSMTFLASAWNWEGFPATLVWRIQTWRLLHNKQALEHSPRQSWRFVEANPDESSTGG